MSHSLISVFSCSHGPLGNEVSHWSVRTWLKPHTHSHTRVRSHFFMWHGAMTGDESIGVSSSLLPGVFPTDEPFFVTENLKQRTENREQRTANTTVFWVLSKTLLFSAGTLISFGTQLEFIYQVHTDVSGGPADCSVASCLLILVMFYQSKQFISSSIAFLAIFHLVWTLLLTLLLTWQGIRRTCDTTVWSLTGFPLVINVCHERPETRSSTTRIYFI